MEYGNGDKNQLIWKTAENKYHNANFDVDENNMNVNVAMLAKFVGIDDTILDIGCGEGKFGIVLKEKHCNLYGIDVDLSACREASVKGYYKKTFCINIEKPEQTSEEYRDFLAENIQFDKIALIDILEHVINPTAVLNNAVKLLKDGGKVLISVPNVNNGDILLNLMRDRFNYREAGVLDNTHTKYFTKRSFVEWIEEINEIYDYTLDCEYVGSTFGYTDYLEEIRNTKPKVYEFIQANPYFHVIQHLFVLSYSARKDKTKCVNLNSLLNDVPVDLTEILERVLSVSNNINRIHVLPNERRILRERCESSEKGWKKCSEELENANKKIAELDLELRKSSLKIDEQNDALKKASDKIKEQSDALQKTADKINEQDDALQKASDKINEQDDALQKASDYQKMLEKNIKRKEEEYAALDFMYNRELKKLQEVENTRKLKLMEIINGKSKKN